MTDTIPNPDAIPAPSTEAAPCHSHGEGPRLGTTTQATIHCLTGCVIGEVAGLMIGVSLGWSAWATMGLATALAFLTGMSLTVFPLARRENLSLASAFQAVWLGEVVSITVMEIAMNGTDYMVGGVHAASVFEPIFWLGMAAAIPAGFIAAWPVNRWLIGRQLKRCH